MTLKQVKEHFKDAKIVRCLADGQLYDITKNGLFNKDVYDVWLDLFDTQNNETYVSLHNKKNGSLAEIVEYKKENKMSDSIKKYEEMMEDMAEWINRKPDHYKTDSIDVIDFCKQYNLNFNKGNIIKYICRAGKKENEPELKDLEKALVYLQREINYLNQN